MSSPTRRENHLTPAIERGHDHNRGAQQESSASSTPVPAPWLRLNDRSTRRPTRAAETGLWVAGGTDLLAYALRTAPPSSPSATSNHAAPQVTETCDSPNGRGEAAPMTAHFTVPLRLTTRPSNALASWAELLHHLAVGPAVTWQLSVQLHNNQVSVALQAHAAGLASDVERELGVVRSRLLLVLHSNKSWLSVDTLHPDVATGTMTTGSLETSQPSDDWQVGEYFTQAVREGTDKASFASWRSSIGDLDTIVDTLRLQGGRARYVVSLRSTRTTSDERNTMRDAGQPVASGEALAFEARVHLAVQGQLREGLADLLGARIFGRQGLIGAFDQGTVTNNVASHGTFHFEQPSGDDARRKALWNLMHGAMLPWARPALGERRTRTSRLVTPLHAMTVFRLPGVGDEQLLPCLPLPLPGRLATTGAVMGDLVDGSVYRQPDSDAALHTHIVGMTGMGKSALLLQIALQRIEAGHGLCVIDPHGELVDELLVRLTPDLVQGRDVVVIDPTEIEAPVCINPLSYPSGQPELRSRVVDFVMAMISDLYNMAQVAGPMFETYFRVGLLSLMDAANGPVALTDLERLLIDEEFRDRVIAKLRDPVLKRKWEEFNNVTGGNDSSLRNMAPYITSKLNALIYNRYLRPMLAAERSSVDFPDLVRNRSIVLVSLRKGPVGAAAGNLLGRVVLSQLVMTAMQRSRAEAAASPFHVIVDEFQNLMTSAIGEALAEVRKYGMRLTLAHQHLGQLSTQVEGAVFGNVGTTAMFRVGARDAAQLAGSMAAPELARMLTQLPAYHAVVQTQQARRPLPPFVMATRPPSVAIDDEWADIWREQSRSRFGVEQR